MTHKYGWICLFFLSVFGMACTDSENNDDTNNGTKKVALTCADVDRAQDAPVLTGADVELKGTYKIKGRFIYDAGQVVNIAPGTVFLMEPDSRVYFGWRSDPATVFARGTKEAPILFCGTSEGSGHWKDIQVLGGTTTDSVLEHVRIEDSGGGADATDVAASLYLSVAIDLKHVTVLNSSRVGLSMDGLGEDSTELTVKGSKLNGLALGGFSAINNLPSGDYTENGEDVALVSGFTNTNVVFTDRGVPYRQTEERVIFGAAGGPLTSITINEGVTYQFCQDCFMYVGWRSDPGAMYVNGTSEKPVTFTSANATPMAGDWDGIHWLTGTKSDSVINYAKFEYGGKADAGSLIISGGKGTVSNSTFSNSAGAGVLVSSEEDGLTIEDNNTYENNAEGDLVLPE